MPIMYDVVAYFSPPVNGRERAHTREPMVEAVFAETPESAARMWLHRLSAVERKVTARIVVFAPKPRGSIDTYRGPEVRFRRVEGKLVEEGPSD
jgi:hypothetical protein